MPKTFSGKYRTYKFFSLTVILILVLTACGAGQPEIPPPTDTPIAETPAITGPITLAIANCAGMTVNVVGTKNVKGGTCTGNELARFTVNGEVVQGYVRTKMTTYQDDPLTWTVQFDGVILHAGDLPSTLFQTTCTKPGDEKLTQDIALTVTCWNDEKDWLIEITMPITVITSTALQAPATQAILVPLKNMVEGDVYLFYQKNSTIYYVQEGNIEAVSTYKHIVVGRLLNKDAFRVELFGLDDQATRVIATLNPDNVDGGFSYLTTDKLLEGRVYNLCPTDTDEVASNASVIKQCINGVYLGTEISNGTKWQFNIDGTISLYTISGAFPDPRP